ncbi:hypothetical protein D6855_13760 [Butyrivibrio sp. CB08]|uniref:cobalt-precorrin-5B (C(1))-methyltransferase CbiD n=1 Tax=Butyrivibrio sp. CB08 TaxID=2364879 RepID=UPI000EA8E3DD|nr:cobalt-precorrin-5B (C(1))-methyltransferase CbiD [Butyrivibrio sp. CB08]RKM57605.1 hypothetical protein D6855_13760 [Butyrivibrio sp. CB08]
MDRFTGLKLSQISSGDCAAAAARAAAAELIFNIHYENVTIHHEHGATRTYIVERVAANCSYQSCEYVCTMEGGMAPDIKERANIHVRVSRVTNMTEALDGSVLDIRYGNLFLKGGEGIGTAMTDQPGIKKGNPLFEKEAAALIFDAVSDVCEMSDGAQLLLITVSCPEGAMIAARNPMSAQSGFAGGIRIMGSYGTIQPVHMREISESIDEQIKAQTAVGVRSILVSPGKYCAKQINEALHVDLKTAISCYNFPGQAIDCAVEEGVQNILLVGNVGKLVKLAAGIMNTNSVASDGRREIFSAHTALVGGTSSQVKLIMACATCDEVLAYLESWGLKDLVMQSIMSEIDKAMKKRCAGKLTCGVALFSEQFGFLGKTADTAAVIAKVSQEQFALSRRLN